jgi:hypothetical protein
MDSSRMFGDEPRCLTRVFEVSQKQVLTASESKPLTGRVDIDE